MAAEQQDSSEEEGDAESEALKQAHEQKGNERSTRGRKLKSPASTRTALQENIMSPSL